MQLIELSDIESFFYPSKIEMGIKIPMIGDNIVIYAKLDSSYEILKLLFVTEAYKRNGITNISVIIPYLPYARQDRVMSKNESFSLRVIANLLNSQNYTKVYLFDAYSDVSSILINNSVDISNHEFVRTVLNDNNISNSLLVSPDAGAYKKIYKLAEYLGYTDDIIMCNKVRNLSDGSIANINVNTADIGGRDVVIVDDICSRGGTFIGLAKKLRELNCGKIYLIVSHYENSADIKVLKQYIDNIYTTTSIYSSSIDNFITMYNVKEFLYGEL